MFIFKYKILLLTPPPFYHHKKKKKNQYSITYKYILKILSKNVLIFFRNFVNKNKIA